MARTKGTTKIELNDALVNEWREFGKIRLEFNIIAKIKCVTPETISKYHKLFPDLIEAYNEGWGETDSKLKNIAVLKALKGDNDMIKWCSKNLTSWKEIQHHRGEGMVSHMIVQLSGKAKPEIENRINEYLANTKSNSEA